MMTPVRLVVDPRSPVPVSEQLVARLRAGIERGRPGPGERVPTVRALAEDLGVAPNTVAKAYRELERAGYVEARGRAGTFVARTLPAPPGALEERLAAAAEAFARRARQLGATDAEAAAAVRRALRPPDTRTRSDTPPTA
jgi:DNA-binding transcriptional regulator YhcF (GntR family)